MKIVVLKSCPNKHGSSNLLSDEVIKGAEESGLSVAEIDVARVNVTPCIGCVGNGNHGQFSRDGLWHSRLVYTRTGIVDRKLKIDIKKEDFRRSQTAESPCLLWISLVSKTAN